MKSYGQRAFSVAVPRLWNKLPFEIRACSDVYLVKSKWKTFLFKKVYDIQFHHICLFVVVVVVFFFSFPFLRCVIHAKKPNIQFPICTVGLYVSLCLMIFLCPFLHCKALRTEMYKRYINSIIIIIIIIIIIHHQFLVFCYL